MHLKLIVIVGTLGILGSGCNAPAGQQAPGDLQPDATDGASNPPEVAPPDGSSEELPSDTDPGRVDAVQGDGTVPPDATPPVDVPDTSGPVDVTVDASPNDVPAPDAPQGPDADDAAGTADGNGDIADPPDTNGETSPPSGPPMVLSSSAFQPGAAIPEVYTVNGADTSPPLSWADAPSTTASFALICDDPDAPTPDPFVHWVIYDIPSDYQGLAAAIPTDEEPAAFAPIKQGKNSFFTTGYRGPAPPAGDGPHTYRFRLYALADTFSPPLPSFTTKASLLNTMAGHILAEAELTGTYEQPLPVPTENATWEASSAVFANPERGFYAWSDWFAPVDVNGIKALADDENIRLIYRNYYLTEFVEAPISEAYLTAVENDLAAFREAGAKVILRFAYTKPESGDTTFDPPYGDASPSQVLDHVAQLGPIVAANSDVIAVWQSGFIGYWGEWYYTDTYGGPDSWTAEDFANRQELVTAMLDALPADRQIQLRTSAYKKQLLGVSEPLSPTTCFDGSAAARVGHYNDCFLASTTDYGTYTDPNADYPWVAADTACVVMGGETCNPNPPRSECDTALTELALFHWSYINSDYHPEVLAGWVDGGCMDDIERRLGYRLRLVEGTLPTAGAPGRVLPVALTVTNDGFAAPFNPRTVALVLRHSVSGERWRVELPIDPRRWVPENNPHLVSVQVALPAELPLGDYEVLVHLSDPAPSLWERPEYAIRLANVTGWEPLTGLHSLGHTLTVGDQPWGFPADAEPVFEVWPGVD